MGVHAQILSLKVVVALRVVELGLHGLHGELLVNLLVVKALLDVGLVQLKDKLLLELNLFALHVFNVRILHWH